MKWVMKDPVRGDMIRVALGSIYHFGIYVSDEEVIQFGLAPSQRAMLRDSEVEVVSSDIDGFLAGGFLEVCEFDKKERKKHRSPDAVVAYAQSKLGMRGYNCTDKTGKIADVKVVAEDDDILMISDDGTMIRMAASGISLYGRATQGVRVMKVPEGVKVISVARTDKEPGEEETVETETVEE